MTAADADYGAEYPLIDEGWSRPELHDCEKRVDGVLCMATAVGAVYSGWTDYVWLCAAHIDGEVAKGWERVDFTEDENDG